MTNENFLDWLTTISQLGGISISYSNCEPNFTHLISISSYSVKSDGLKLNDMVFLVGKEVSGCLNTWTWVRRERQTENGSIDAN